MPEIDRPADETGLEVILDQRAAVDLVLADTAVVAALRFGVTGRGEPVRTTVLHEREFLLDAEHRLVLLVLLGGPDGCGAGVGRVRLAVDEHHLTHHEDVVAATDRIRVARNGLEDAVALVARRLARARAVESPQSGVRRRLPGSWSSSGASTSVAFRRPRCIRPCKPQLSSIPRGYRRTNLRCRPMAGGIVAASGCRVVAPL